MGKLFIGSDAIKLRDAVKLVNQNICELQKKLSDVSVDGRLSVQIKSFYERKIEAQKTTLQWLQKAL